MPTFSDFFSALAASWRKSEAQGMPLLAGGVAYFVFLAIAPLTIAIVMVYAWLRGEQTVGQRVSALD